MRSLLADAILCRTAESDQLGSVTLYRHQLDAVARVRRSIERCGGALLSDAVGLGKTYVALAVARRYQAPLVVAPAVLRMRWEDAVSRAGATLRFISTESLSRSDARAEHDFVIVDEAHHFRNADTRRYRRLAELTATSPTLLLSATPVHNSREDLHALLALFLGSRARSAGAAVIGSCVIRRLHSDLPAVHVPAVTSRRVEIPADTSTLQAILKLPPPVPARDGKAAASLVRTTLAQLWCSSDAALLAGIRRRIACGEALRQSLAHGLVPSKSELATWSGCADAVQLGFVELLVEPVVRADATLHRCLDEHLSALRTLLSRLRASPARDRARAAAIRDLCARHRGQRLVAFSSFAATVKALFTELKRYERVAAVTSRAAELISGRAGTDDVLRTFRRPAHLRERIDLLISTDLLSEGIDLPEASVAINLDLPWTAARLEQRIGRLRRIGSDAARVTVYDLVLPAAAEQILAREALVRHKAQLSRSLVGALTLASVNDDRTAPPRAAEEVRKVARSWRSPDKLYARGDTVRVAAVASAQRGFLARVRRSGETLIVSGSRRQDGSWYVSGDPAALLDAFRRASGSAIRVCATAYASARRVLEDHLRSESLSLAIDVEYVAPEKLIPLLRRLDEMVATAPAHERLQIATRLARVRAGLHARLTAGMELRLQLAGAEAHTDSDLLDRCETVLGDFRVAAPVEAARLEAVLLLVTGDRSPRHP